MDVKKITFGFSKTIKKPQLQFSKKTEESKVEKELISCLEGKEIKLTNNISKADPQPLVIPLQNSAKSLKALESLKIRKAVLEGTDVENGKEKIENIDKSILDNSNLDSLEKRAIQELLAEANKDAKIGTTEIYSNLTLTVKADELPLDGAKESTLNDYESIPINQFGMAMLRGMGLTDNEIKKQSPDDDILCPRPKGMGLGADKAIKRQPLLIPPEENEKLEIKKNSFVKILAGKHKNQYGQVEGMDDQTGRIIIKLALGGHRESLGEYLMQPVSKKEFQTYGKVINSEKYEEYKRKQEANDQNNSIKSEKIIKEETFKEFPSQDNEMKSKLLVKEENFKTQEYRGESKSFDSYKNSSSSHSKGSDLRSYSTNYYNETKDVENYRHPKTSKHSERKYENSHSTRRYEPQRSRSRNRFHKEDSKTESDYSSDSSSQRYKHKSSKSKKSSKKSKRNKYKYNSSSEDEKKHKKKTKKSRRSRSRSRSRHRR